MVDLQCDAGENRTAIWPLSFAAGARTEPPTRGGRAGRSYGAGARPERTSVADGAAHASVENAEAMPVCPKR